MPTRRVEGRRPDHQCGLARLYRFARLDIPVSNAGVFISKPLTDYTTAWVNLAGFFWLTERAIAELVSRYDGHVVNVSATIAEVANSGTPLVLAAPTKGGLAAATRSLAVGYTSRGILVNAAHPASPQCPYRKTSTATSSTCCARLVDLVRAGSDVVLDFSFWSRRMRDEYRELLRPFGIVPETVYLVTDRDTVLRRIGARAARDGDDFKISTELAAFYFDHFEIPTAAEGLLTVRK